MRILLGGTGGTGVDTAIPSIDSFDGRMIPPLPGSKASVRAAILWSDARSAVP